MAKETEENEGRNTISIFGIIRNVLPKSGRAYGGYPGGKRTEFEVVEEGNPTKRNPHNRDGRVTRVVAAGESIASFPRGAHARVEGTVKQTKFGRPVVIDRRPGYVEANRVTLKNGERKQLNIQANKSPGAGS